ncbi:MAG TPA: acetyl-CoA carboxylase biotin carboxyl carrier protein [Gemmataceae bacterium]|nr:acetyl-CoA carboxylase biotin carboxyl carrier protein [Gemmataceae bacterium]
MADEDSKAEGPFDVANIRALVALMSRHDLSEIDLRQGEQRIRLRRGALKTTVTTMSGFAPAPAPLPASSAVPAAPKAAAPDAPTKKLIDIKSPTPGTFYARPSPDTDVFVKVGSRVDAKTVVCLIEAMKLYTEIQAECSGVITEILVENAQPVEFDQVLFRVDPTA